MDRSKKLLPVLIMAAALLPGVVIFLATGWPVASAVVLGALLGAFLFWILVLLAAAVRGISKARR